MTAQVAQDLRAAADVLELDGWKQGSYHGSDGCHCAVGAIAVAISGSRRPDPDRWVSDGERARRCVEASQLAARVVGEISRNLAVWNDRPGRTATEVIATLRAAADEADQ